MATVLCVVADAARARLFELDHPGSGIREIESIVNPEGRAQNRDLDTDGPGRFFGKGERQQGHTAPAHVSAVEHDVDLFAKSIAERLERARVEGRCDKLCIVAAPKFLGAVRSHLGKDAARMVDQAIDKDVSHARGDEIERLLRDGWRPH